MGRQYWINQNQEHPHTECELKHTLAQNSRHTCVLLWPFCSLRWAHRPLVVKALTMYLSRNNLAHTIHTWSWCFFSPVPIRGKHVEGYSVCPHCSSDLTTRTLATSNWCGGQRSQFGSQNSDLTHWPQAIARQPWRGLHLTRQAAPFLADWNTWQYGQALDMPLLDV